MSSSRPILFTASRAAPPDAPILAWYSESEASRNALAAAARLARQDGRKLVVYLNSSDPDELAKLELSASRVLPSTAVYRHSAGANIEELVRLWQVERFGLLIVDATTLGDDIEGNLGRLVEVCGCSILLMRG
jgi:hypothetical protein